MKRAVIVHCWEGYPKYCWYPYVKQQLEKHGFVVVVPALPLTEAPRLENWLPAITQVIGTPDEELFLIGHSAGCITILRYLETLPAGTKVGGVVLVAGFTDDLGFDELKNFFETPLDLSEIKKRAQHFTAIHSDNDPFVPLSHGDTFKKELDATLIIKHDAKHFSGAVDDEDSCTELPDVVDSVLKAK